MREWARRWCALAEHRFGGLLTLRSGHGVQAEVTLNMEGEVPSMDGVRVLICEDEGLTALRFRTTLKRLGLDVVGTAANGEQVVEAASRLQPDAILMDIEMPHMDGLTATRRIMEQSPTAILIISAYGENETVEEAIRSGASGYLVKPVTDDQIQPALQAALQAFSTRRAVVAAG